MSDHYSLSRRRLLAAMGSGGIGTAAGCLDLGLPSQDGDPSSVSPRPPPTSTPDTTTTLTAAPGRVEPPSGATVENWLYNDSFPGPEVRLQEGEVFEAELTNELPAGTTIHWHGIPLANPMDGVPNVTQPPTESGDTFTYTFRAEPPGTYFFHSHVGLQLDRGLHAPLIIEEDDPHVEYDREYTVVLDDYLAGEPTPLSETESGWGSGPGGTNDGRGPGGRRGPGGGPMAEHRPPYDGLLIDGRLPDAPRTYSVSEDDRVRFRFVNASSATAYQVRIAGHPLTVTHADGRPVEPVTVDSFAFGSGERYDAVVTADTPGTWEMRAAAVDGDEPPARALVTYENADSSRSPTTPSPDGRRLSYGDLRALSPLDGVDGSPDRTFDLTLSGSRAGTEWLIDGQSFPNADPLPVRQGEHVRIRMVNRSPVLHPMHLHGHFFQVGDAVKDTVIVPSHMGQQTLDFVADNPGDWLFHCHNLYHLEAGMARVVRYES